MKYEKDLTRILDTRKLYIAFFILSVIGLIIAIYIKNLRIIIYESLIIALLLIFKKDLYLYYEIKYEKWLKIRKRKK